VLVPAILLIGLLATLVYNHHDEFSVNGLIAGFDQVLIFSVLAYLHNSRWNFGMGYGATQLHFLLAYGIPPAISTGVHVAEMFTTGASAISASSFENINKKLVRHLLIPGVFGFNY
jgi:uncharacterized membrane protein YfcA